MIANREFVSLISHCVDTSNSRPGLWVKLIQAVQSEQVAEIGVWKGHFAAHLLEACSSIRCYYMIDPWRHLNDWNKPANVNRDEFEAIFSEAMERTKFAEQKRSVLRGKTTEVINTIPDGSLDFVYIDGDHTLKGIAIDLINVYPKLRPGGIIGGDDFCRSIWQHSPKFEPTFVFPFAVYFAEAMGSEIYALPHNQFIIRNCGDIDKEFSFVDRMENYNKVDILSQFTAREILKRRMKEILPNKVRQILLGYTRARKARRWSRAKVK